MSGLHTSSRGGKACWFIRMALRMMFAGAQIALCSLAFCLAAIATVLYLLHQRRHMEIFSLVDQLHSQSLAVGGPIKNTNTLAFVRSTSRASLSKFKTACVGLYKLANSWSLISCQKLCAREHSFRVLNVRRDIGECAVLPFYNDDEYCATPGVLHSGISFRIQPECGERLGASSASPSHIHRWLRATSAQGTESEMTSRGVVPTASNRENLSIGVNNQPPLLESALNRDNRGLPDHLYNHNTAFHSSLVMRYDHEISSHSEVLVPSDLQTSPTPTSHVSRSVENIEAMLVQLLAESAGQSDSRNEKPSYADMNLCNGQFPPALLRTPTTRKSECTIPVSTSASSILNKLRRPSCMLHAHLSTPSLRSMPANSSASLRGCSTPGDQHRSGDLRVLEAMYTNLLQTEDDSRKDITRLDTFQNVNCRESHIFKVRPPLTNHASSSPSRLAVETPSMRTRHIVRPLRGLSTDSELSSRSKKFPSRAKLYKALYECGIEPVDTVR